MIKNRKTFVAPDDSETDFKSLFRRLAAAGAGRPADGDGFPEGPWTPESLADAISQIDANKSGIDVRTVQLWFQDNDKGISPDNIRWLARVFGCDDPDATSAWQRKLVEAQSRLAASRRQVRGQLIGTSDMSHQPPEVGRQKTDDLANDAHPPSIAQFTEALFSMGLRFNLPTIIAVGGVILGFGSTMLNIHNFEHPLSHGQAKQVGFLWAPNWTVVTWILMPLFVLFVGDLVTYWRNNGRSEFLLRGEAIAASDRDWASRVQSFSSSYWAMFVVSLPVAFFLQWSIHYLIPLMSGAVGNQALNWGLITIQHPDIISARAAATFTFLAYLYLGLCIYLFFSGLLLIQTVVEDIQHIAESTQLHSDFEGTHRGRAVVEHVMRRVFRCTVIGLLIPMVIKLQQVYLTSQEGNIATWLASDFRGLWDGNFPAAAAPLDNSVSTHFTSIVIVLATSAVFVQGVIRLKSALRTGCQRQASIDEPKVDRTIPSDARPFTAMIGVILMLLLAYVMIGAFPGFSVLLLATALVASYSLFDPSMGFGHRREAERLVF